MPVKESVCMFGVTLISTKRILMQFLPFYGEFLEKKTQLEAVNITNERLVV